MMKAAKECPRPSAHSQKTGRGKEGPCPVGCRGSQPCCHFEFGLLAWQAVGALGSESRRAHRGRAPDEHPHPLLSWHVLCDVGFPALWAVPIPFPCCFRPGPSSSQTKF